MIKADLLKGMVVLQQQNSLQGWFEYRYYSSSLFTFLELWINGRLKSLTTMLYDNLSNAFQLQNKL